VRTHYNFRKFLSFSQQKLRTFSSEEFPCLQNVRNGQTLSLDCGRLIWTAHKQDAIFIYMQTIGRILKANLSWSPTWAKFCQLFASFIRDSTSA